MLRIAAAAAAILPAGARRWLYRLGPVSRALRYALNQAAPEGLNEVTVAAGELRGTRLLLDLQREKDLWLGNYEFDLQHALAEHLVPGDTVYDVGANIGYISLIAAKMVGDDGRVFSFEALPANVERLKQNLALNPGIHNVSPQPVAVADKAGQLKFLIHPSGGMGKLKGVAGRQTSYAGSIQVPAISLDDFVHRDGNPAPDLIKIDIEGAEGLALKGARRMLTEARPIFFIELHGPEAARAVWDELDQAGYTLHTMTKPHIAIQSLAELDWKSYVLAKSADG